MNEKQKLICEIMQLAYLVQEFTKYCVFIRFSGHVDSLEIQICESKEKWRNELLQTDFYTKYKEYRDNQDNLAQYKAKRDILLRIILEKSVPFEDCDVERYITEEYTF